MAKKVVLLLLLFFLLLCVAGGVGLVWGYFYFTRDLPNFERADDYRPDLVSYIYAADGSKVAEFFRERRYPMKLEEVPLFVQNAFLAAEDAAFFSHPGIDPVSVLRATIKNLQTGTAKQGGSTITQQVVKNILLTREKSLERKIKEAILAYRLERRLSKKEILQLYLNQIFFGNTAYGLKAAARVYFHKEVADLSLAEAALLAGLPKAPSRYSPLSNFGKAKERQKYVLSQMVKAGFVEPTVVEEAFKEEIKVLSLIHI